MERGAIWDWRLFAEQQRLADLRALARTMAGPDVAAVEFVEDDITASTVAPRTSSRKSEPRSAPRKSPLRAAAAPVNAPRTCPNSSDSTSVDGTAATLIITKPAGTAQNDLLIVFKDRKALDTFTLEEWRQYSELFGEDVLERALRASGAPVRMPTPPA